MVGGKISPLGKSFPPRRLLLAHFQRTHSLHSYFLALVVLVARITSTCMSRLVLTAVLFGAFLVIRIGRRSIAFVLTWVPQPPVLLAQFIRLLLLHRVLAFLLVCTRITRFLLRQMLMDISSSKFLTSLVLLTLSRSRLTQRFRLVALLLTTSSRGLVIPSAS